MRLEEQLFNRGFGRTHKSFLVSKRFIRSIDSTRVLLDTGEELPVGKRYYAESWRASAWQAKAKLNASSIGKPPCKTLHSSNQRHARNAMMKRANRISLAA